MTIKGPSRKQVIISMSEDNARTIVSQANTHISNINRLLKGVKSEILANFIQFDNKEIITTTNKITANSDLKLVEEYIKKLNDINSNQVMCSCLSQSKFYLKILEIPYYIVNTNSPIIFDIIEKVIKDIHIFNDIVLASCLCIIKASPKLNMAII